MKRRPERGAAAVMFALMGTMLLAAAGLGVDTAHVAYDDSRVQHSADAAALAIAHDCATGELNCTKDGATLTADEFAEANSGGDTGSITAASLAPADGTVTAGVEKRVTTNFFNAFGIDHKNVSAEATATWNNHPIKGSVLPFVVSMCQYAAQPIGTPTLLHTDVNDVAKANSTAFTGPTTEAYAKMAPYLIDPACPVPPEVDVPTDPSTVTMLHGGLWVSDSGNNVCNGNIVLSVNEPPKQDPLAANETCTKKYNDPEFLNQGDVIMMAIYAPSTNFDHAGIHVEGTNVPGPATFHVVIVGFAPFELSGWCLTSQPTSCGGVNPGAIGIAGKFVKSSTPVPDFEYGPGVGDFGAYQVKLTN